jgi:hypothetical protein
MLDWSTSTMVGRSMGIDVAWGSTSKFAIVITQYRNRKVEVFYAESFEKPRMNEIINHIMQLKQKHQITKLYVDGANPEVKSVEGKDRRVSRLLWLSNRRTDLGSAIAIAGRSYLLTFRRDIERCCKGHIL